MPGCVCGEGHMCTWQRGHVCPGGHACLGVGACMPVGICVAGGVHGGECVWQRSHGWQGMCIAVISCFYRCLSVHRGACMPRGCAWWGVHGRGACMPGGRGCACPGGMHGRGVCMVGVCMVGGVYGRGCAWQKGACLAGGIHSGVCVWQGVACVAEGGMHDSVCGRGHAWLRCAWQERRPLQRVVCIRLECILILQIIVIKLTIFRDFISLIIVFDNPYKYNGQSQKCNGKFIISIKSSALTVLVFGPQQSNK